ncbi:MAG: lipid-A-disaccharide synthase [Planctomycetes bacterium]|nr:lipid-A-disaccharide synthase [Planctomycetota bacterium]
MVALEVAVTLMREVLRALLVPFRLLAYLPFRHHWRRVAREVLDAAAHADPESPDEALREFFARKRPARGERPHLFVSAGEASGEAHAARLVRALPPAVRTTAFGGHLLADAGAAVRIGLSEHAVMGVFGVLRQLPLILRAFADYLRVLRDDPPDLVVLVDYPGLHVVMAKAARRRRIPVLHYVAPQYWAWGPWRMRRYRRAVDATLTILPFETSFFRRFRIPAAYIGHPLLDEIAAHPPEPAATAAVRERPTLVLLPGSRRAEITANLPGMLRVARSLRSAFPGCRIVLPHKSGKRTPLIRELLAHEEATFVEHHEGTLAPWLAGARLVLAKSGTGSLEACLFGNPTIVVYQLRGTIHTLGYHNILSVPWIAAANLIAGRAAVPEFCFHRADGWNDVAHAAGELWRDGPARDSAIAALGDVRHRLGEPGATARVAAIVGRFLGVTA